MADISERKSHKVLPVRVKVGDLMAFVYYVRVKKVDPAVPSLVVEDLDHDQGDFAVAGTRLISGAFSADQFQEEEKVTMTRAAEILIASYNRPLTVCFIKQSGGLRVMRGRLLKPEPLLGRSHVEDLDVPGRSRLRLVDHRTIKYLIVDGVKYIVKRK
jgi:hypothetical protein